MALQQEILREVQVFQPVSWSSLCSGRAGRLPRASAFLWIPWIPSAVVVSLSLRGLLLQVWLRVLGSLFVWANCTSSFKHQQRKTFGMLTQACIKRAKTQVNTSEEA